MNLVQSAVWDGIKGCFSDEATVSFRGAPSWTLAVEPVPGIGDEIWVHMQPSLRVRLMDAPLTDLPRMAAKLGARLNEEMSKPGSTIVNAQSGVIELEESWLES